MSLKDYLVYTSRGVEIQVALVLCNGHNEESLRLALDRKAVQQHQQGDDFEGCHFQPQLDPYIITLYSTFFSPHLTLNFLKFPQHITESS